jgi:predicted transcriptional regulator
MHDQRSPTVAEDEERADFAVLHLLTDDDAQRPWTVDEVAREIGDRIEAEDSLARLYGAGLVHRIEGFVFATRPALRAVRLAEQ